MRARRTDANQAEIVAAYRAHGCSVVVVLGAFDLLVGTRGVTDAVECKDGAKSPSKRKLTPAENALHAGWRGAPIRIVETVSDVARHVNDMHLRAQWISDGRLAFDVPRRDLQ